MLDDVHIGSRSWPLLDSGREQVHDLGEACRMQSG
jgi:hypothetical protein